MPTTSTRTFLLSTFGAFRELVDVLTALWTFPKLGLVGASLSTTALGALTELPMALAALWTTARLRFHCRACLLPVGGRFSRLAALR